MKITEYEIDPGEIQIDPKMIADLMRLDIENIPEPYGEIIRNELEGIKNFDDIKGGYVISENMVLNEAEGIFISENVQFQAGKDAVHFLKNSEMLAFFICTAGETISNRSQELMNTGSLLEGYVSDIIGSVLTEVVMDIIHKKLSVQMLEKGLKTTNRYSPGNCDWQVEEQIKLFNFFPENFCGVSLSNSSLMSPIKSVSGVIGIGKSVRYHNNVCSICKNLDCIYREKKYTSIGLSVPP